MRPNFAKSALVLNCLIVLRIFAKCAANVVRILFDYVGFLCWKAAQTLLHEVSLIILYIRKNEEIF